MQVLTTIPRGTPNSTCPCQATWPIPFPEPRNVMRWYEADSGSWPCHSWQLPEPGHPQNLWYYLFIPYSFFVRSAHSSTQQGWTLLASEEAGTDAHQFIAIYDRIWEEIGPKVIVALCVKSAWDPELGHSSYMLDALWQLQQKNFKGHFWITAHDEILFCKVLSVPSFFQEIQDLWRTCLFQILWREVVLFFF